MRYSIQSGNKEVEAFKMHELLQYPYEPEWFLDAEKSGLIHVLWYPTARFGASDPLRQCYAAVCRISKHGGGYSQANEGDYIVKKQDGDILSCNAYFFENMFSMAK